MMFCLRFFWVWVDELRGVDDFLEIFFVVGVI